MRLRAPASILVAALLIASATRADEQSSASASTSSPAPAAVASVTPAFTSVSSLPAPSTVPATPANPPPVALPAPVATLAFSSISSLGADAGASGAGPMLPTAASLMADRILVEKGKRRLYLLSRGRVIAEYPVKLGLSPKGHKQFEGDFRTPEGVYHLSRRNPRSEFFLSVEVSYPNETDRARAEAEGLRPGGLIMIHGQPNVPRRPKEYYASTDWTDGCIAVSNSAMVDIWQRTRLGIPIEIRP